MPYGSAAAEGGLAATGLAVGHLWLVGLSLALVLTGAVLVRAGFRRNREPRDR